MGKKEIIDILETCLDDEWELAEKLLNERIEKLKAKINGDPL